MLDNMNVDQIKSRLIEEGYADNAVTEGTAKRLHSLNGESAKMLEQWVSNNIVPEFAPIEGIGSDFLVSKLKMKAPALIIAYAMLEEEPKENSRYFKHLSENITGFYPNLTI